MPELIDKKRTEAGVFLIARLFIDRPDHEFELVKAVIHRCCEEIDKQPTIEPEVRCMKRCEYCKGRSYTKKPLTVITRTMKRVNVCFNFCPNCGRDMRATDTNVGGKGGADNG